MIVLSFILFLFKPILFTCDILTIHSNLKFFNVLIDSPFYWRIVKLLFIFSLVTSNIIIFNFIFSLFIHTNQNKKNNIIAPNFGLCIGKDLHNNNVYIPESSLYQNILVTGCIGSGKTSSALYPFTFQLMKYESSNCIKKLGFLILDVKGNYSNKVLEFAHSCNRESDVIVIEINGFYKYNPLDKPDIKASVLANRLKNILLLFSPNNSESYWIDKAEQILEACINFCRLYNNYYVSFDEIHKLVTNYEYFSQKVSTIRKIFLSGNLSDAEIYNLHSSISFLENDYFCLDSRNFNLLKSEITRITNCFVSDYEVKKTFCPSKINENFFGFDEAIRDGKIVVLNMNIAQYKNLSKIISAYLKLDFQTDVLKRLSNSPTFVRPMVFISDEYQEYVTSSDADFFSQSREAKCINIISTQSYTSILNSLNSQYSAKVIIQNLVNKLWFRTDDIFTIEDIQKQIGKEEKSKISKTFSENSKQSNYDCFFKNFISVDSNLSESINSYSQFDYIFDYKFFTQDLDTFSCVAFLSTGKSIIKPQKLNMLPYFLKEDFYENKKK